MAYVKHPEHGNKHVPDHQVAELVKQGWVKWPRTAEEKALGDGSDAAYWRKKYERDIAEQSPNRGGGGGPLEPALVAEETTKRGPGRPAKG